MTEPETRVQMYGGRVTRFLEECKAVGCEVVPHSVLQPLISERNRIANPLTKICNKAYKTLDIVELNNIVECILTSEAQNGALR